MFTSRAVASSSVSFMIGCIPTFWVVIQLAGVVLFFLVLLFFDGLLWRRKPVLMIH